MSTGEKRKNHLYNDESIVISNDLALEILSKSGIWFIITDQSGRFKYVSEGCIKISGYSSEEFITNSKLLEVLINPEDLDSYRNISLNEGINIRIIDKNSEIKWVNIETKRNITYQGKQYKLLIITDKPNEESNLNQSQEIEDPSISGHSSDYSSLCLKDISLDEKTRGTNKDQEHCLFNIFNNVPIGVATLNMKGEISYCNPSLCKIFGYTEDEFQKLSVYDLTFPEDRDYLKKQFSGLLEGEHNHFKFIRKQRTKDNRVIWIRALVFSNCSNQEDQVSNIAIVEDITSIHQVKETLKISEKRFNWVLKFLPDIVTILDESGNMIYNSPAYSQILGYSEEERAGGHVKDYVHPDDWHIFTQKFQEVLVNPEKLISHQYRFRHKNGDYRWMEAIASNQSSIIVSIERDVTKRKQMEDELEETNQKLQALNKTKDRLFSVIAHDLRSPFNSLIGLTEILLDKNNKKNQEEIFIQSIHEISYETYQLLENLLQWFRIQSDEIKFNPASLNWAQVLSGCISFFKSQVLKKELSLSLNVSK
ncbi:MAG: PAS domain S-box protein, partial [Bacteroidota bacterium]|nr:PAS domain S-box protein [Bacteroidota bacterium]